MIYHSSLTLIIIGLFRASLLFVALLSTNFDVHFTSSLPLLSEFVVSCFLFFNIAFACKKMTSHECERNVQPNKLPEQEAVSMKNRVHNGDSNALDQPQVSDLTIKNSLFELDSICLEDEVEFEATSLDKLISESSSLALEDVDEDYMIEIPLSEQRVVSFELNERDNLVNLLSDMNDIGGEDNLIEIDISMGSIRHSVLGCEITT